MYSGSAKRSPFIVIIFLCALISHVHAGCVEVGFDDGYANDWFINTFDSDFNIDDGDIHNIRFDSDSALNGIGAAIISGTHKINAIHQLDSGNFVFSTYSNVTVGGVKYESGDLIKYDVDTGNSNLYFSGDNFSKKENIDAVYIRENGNIVFSTKTDAQLGGVSFKKGDAIEYDPFSGKSKVLVNGDAFGVTGNIDALHILDDGDILFSIFQSAELGDMRIGGEDLFRLDVQTGMTSIAIDNIKNTHSHNIDGFTTPIPESATATLLIAGVLLGALRQKNH